MRRIIYALTANDWSAPGYEVRLDTSELPDHDLVSLRICGGHTDSREAALIYAALRAGHYQLDGGYPCPRCGDRHGPLAVKRYEAPDFWGSYVWTTADASR